MTSSLLERIYAMAPHIIRIGSAGWSIPAAHKRDFPGAGTHLERYALRMTCTEINSSFYRPHQRKTYEKWAAATPHGFRFAVKAPRQLTQIQRLKNPEPVIDRFSDEVSGLGRKLGIVLVQLPPSLTFEAKVAEEFFAAFKERVWVPIACEPRHASWFTREVDAWMKARRIARVAADPARAEGAGKPGGWRGLTYIRLHGAPRTYWSAYDADFLKKITMTLKREKVPSWCIFDNTAQGHALGDALAIRRRLKRSN